MEGSALFSGEKRQCHTLPVQQPADRQSRFTRIGLTRLLRIDQLSMKLSGRSSVVPRMNSNASVVHQGTRYDKLHLRCRVGLGQRPHPVLSSCPLPSRPPRPLDTTGLNHRNRLGFQNVQRPEEASPLSKIDYKLVLSKGVSISNQRNAVVGPTTFPSFWDNSLDVSASVMDKPPSCQRNVSRCECLEFFG